MARLRTGHRWARRRRVFTWLGVLAAIALVAGVLVAVYGPLTHVAAGPTVEGMTDREKKAAAINAVRQTLLATTAGVAALAGLVITGRSYLLARRGQLTDRYTKAIAQLASEKLEERLGGIYALEHLMVESTRDHTTVVDVLAAFIREHAPATPAESATGPVGAESIAVPTTTPQRTRRPATDVQAALTVLSRRPDRREPHAIDLYETDLRGCSLDGASFEGVIFTRALLQDANLDRAQLQRADLTEAQLQNASLFRAQLQGASLAEAQLQDANLTEAQLQNADLREAQSSAPACSGRSSKAPFWPRRSSKARSCPRLKPNSPSSPGLSSKAPTYAERSSKAPAWSRRSSKAPICPGRISRRPHGRGAAQVRQLGRRATPKLRLPDSRTTP